MDKLDLLWLPLSNTFDRALEVRIYGCASMPMSIKNSSNTDISIHYIQSPWDDFKKKHLAREELVADMLMDINTTKNVVFVGDNYLFKPALQRVNQKKIPCYCIKFGDISGSIRKLFDHFIDGFKLTCDAKILHVGSASLLLNELLEEDKEQGLQYTKAIKLFAAYNYEKDQRTWQGHGSFLNFILHINPMIVSERERLFLAEETSSSDYAHLNLEEKLELLSPPQPLLNKALYSRIFKHLANIKVENQQPYSEFEACFFNKLSEDDIAISRQDSNNLLYNTFEYCRQSTNDEFIAEKYLNVLIMALAKKYQRLFTNEEKGNLIELIL